MLPAVRARLGTALVGLALLAACSGSPVPDGLCTAPRTSPGTVFAGSLRTTIEGVPVDEPATVRLSGTSRALTVSIAPEGGSESSCLLGAAGGDVKAGYCQDPGDATGTTVLTIEGGKIATPDPDHVAIDVRGSVLGVLPGAGPQSSMHVAWSFTGKKLVPAGPPATADEKPVLKMHFGPRPAGWSFLDAPFPNATRAGASGAVDASDFPAARAAPMPFPSIMGHLVFATLQDILSTLRDMGAARGFGVTSGVFFQSTVPLTKIDSVKIHASIDEPFVLVPVLPSGALGAPHPVRVHFRETGGSLAVPNTLAVLPLQGRPLLEDTLYLAFVRTGPSTRDGRGLGRAREMDLLAGALAGAPSPDVPPDYARALQALRAAHGPDLDSIAALTVFRTGKPTEDLVRLRSRLAARMKLTEPFVTREVGEELCVYESEAEVPVYQRGTPPYQLGDSVLPSAVDALARVLTKTTRGGAMAFEPSPQATAKSRVVLTVPRSAKAPAAGWPAAVLVRAGAGLESDQSALVDRGPTIAPGEDKVAGCLTMPGQDKPRHPSEYRCGAGPAREFARAGFLGVTVDGPQTGNRLVAGSPAFDALVQQCAIPPYSGEDWAMFDVCNPRAITDNVRESALETALVPDLLLAGPLQVKAGDPDPCRLNGARVDPARLALMGHSMGATITPLVLAIERRFRAVVLSGANGSYIENVVTKERPSPLATTLEQQLNLQSCTTEFDLLPSLFQWAEEPSDPAVYEPLVFGPSVKATPPDVIMIQGIGDHYIPSPIANVSSLALDLDLFGSEYDAADPRRCESRDPTRDVPVFTCPDGVRRYPLSPISSLLPLVGRRAVPVVPPAGVAKNRLGATGALVQYRRDRVCRDDGHEVAYDIAQARWQYRCFLRSFGAGGTARLFAPPPENPDDDTLDIKAPCPGP
jgi:hypothetical protein